MLLATISIPDTDFSSVDNMTLIFNSSSSDKSCYEIDITDDSIVEDTEMFQLQLLSDESAVIISTPTVIVNIEDNDGEYYTLCIFFYMAATNDFALGLMVGFLPGNTQTLSEGQQVQICVNHSVTLEREVAVLISDESGTASGKKCSRLLYKVQFN